MGCSNPYKNVKETNEPTLGMASLRLLIAMAVLLGATMHQMDVRRHLSTALCLTPSTLSGQETATKDIRKCGSSSRRCTG